MSALKPIFNRLYQPVASTTLPSVTLINSGKRSLTKSALYCKARRAVEKLPNRILSSSVKTLNSTEKLLSSLDEEVKGVALQHTGTLVKRCYVSKKQPFYVVGKNPIDFVLNTTCDDIKDHDRQIIVANPGPGRLVDSFLAAGANRLLVFEPNKELYPSLKSLEGKFPESLHVENSVLSSALSNVDPWEETASQSVPPSLSKAFSQHVNNVTLVSPTSDNFLLRSLLYLVIDRKIWATEENLVCYFFLPGSLYKKVTSEPKDTARYYRDIYILWQIFFKIEMLEEFPANQFLPIIVDKPLNDLRGIKSDTVFFVKCTPRLWNTSDLAPKQYRLLALFVKQLMAKPSSCFVAALEKWAPGVGIELIKNNYGVFTQSRTLTPMQILEVFLTFANFPEVADSAYWDSLGDSDHLVHEESLEKDRSEFLVAKTS